MMQQAFRTGAVFALTVLAALGCGAAAARAEPLEATLALTIDVLSGDHEIRLRQRDQLHWVPLPIGELTLRRGADTLRIEGMPPLSSTYGTDAAANRGSVKLSILNATYRHALGAGWFAGIGETVYNQATTDVPGLGSGAEQDSRVAGTRVELGRILRLGGDRIEAWGAANPAMHGLVQTRPAGPVFCSFSFPSPPGTLPVCVPFGPGNVTAKDGESASQIDLSARIAHRLGSRGELLYGIRYLNYSARLDAAPGHLADRNVGFAPVVGYRVRL